MGKLDVKHYLFVYSARLKMQEDGVTNPPEMIKKFTKEFVEKLHTLPSEMEIVLKDDAFFDNMGKLIMKIPV